MFSVTSRTAINLLEMWRNPHSKLFAWLQFSTINTVPIIKDTVIRHSVLYDVQCRNAHFIKSTQRVAEWCRIVFSSQCKWTELIFTLVFFIILPLSDIFGYPTVLRAHLSRLIGTLLFFMWGRWKGCVCAFYCPNNVSYMRVYVFFFSIPQTSNAIQFFFLSYDEIKI